MSQYYSQQSPYYPPEQGPEDYYEEGEYEYEDDEGGLSSPLIQSAIAFFAGGCLVFLCMSCLFVLVGGLWVVDPLADSATPELGTDLGLQFASPAFPNETVTNEDGGQLTILDVNRNASLEAIPQVEGREIVIVTIELVNIGPEPIDFNEIDFNLINPNQEAYRPQTQTPSDFGALGRGTLEPNEGLEGRLAFEVLAGDFDLVLFWSPRSGTAQPRYVYIQ